MGDAPKASRSSSFEDLALPWLDAVHDLAVRLCPSFADAEDATQETFARALAAYPRYEPAGSFSAWLFAILRNTIRNRDRDARRHPTEPIADDLPASEEGDASPPWACITSADLDEAFAALSIHVREVVLLRDVRGLSYREVAAVVGCPVGTVMSRLHRGRREVRRSLVARVRGRSTRGSG